MKTFEEYRALIGGKRGTKITADYTTDDPKIEVLARYLGRYNVEGITNSDGLEYEDGETGNVYSIGIYDEIENYARDIVSTLDDSDFSLNDYKNAVLAQKSSEFTDAYKDIDKSYLDDIENEEDETDKFENRLIKELYDAKAIKDNDFEKGPDGKPDYKDFIGELSTAKDIYISDKYKNRKEEDCMDDYISEFGGERFRQFCRDNVISGDDLVDAYIDDCDIFDITFSNKYDTYKLDNVVYYISKQ